ncbi:hypothetical protein GCM10022379_58240 [Micromonospora maritima]
MTFVTGVVGGGAVRGGWGEWRNRADRGLLLEEAARWGPAPGAAGGGGVRGRSPLGKTGRAMSQAVTRLSPDLSAARPARGAATPRTGPEPGDCL